MSGSVIGHWATLLVCVFMLWALLRVIKAFNAAMRARAERIKAETIALYVETGVGEERLQAAYGKRTLSEAKFERRMRIAEREKQSKVFTATTACPACGDEAVHFIGTASWLCMRHDTRTCRSCEHTWRQG